MPEQPFFQPIRSPSSSQQDAQYGFVDNVPADKPGKNAGLIRSVLAFICAGVALLFYPPIFGATGIILGTLAYKKKEKNLGLASIILSVICMIIGLILAFLWIDDIEAAAGILGFILMN